MDTLESMYEKRQITDYVIIREKSGKCIVGVNWGEDESGHGEGMSLTEAIVKALRNYPAERMAA